MTHFDFAPAMRYLPALLAGAGRTLELAAMSLTLGIALGIVLALARMSSVRLLRWPAYGCIEFFRTTPAMIQIIWCYFALPVVIQHDLNSFQATALALGLNAAAFLAEISRTGLQGVDAGQHDAVRVLGLSLVQGFCYVIVPQAVRIVLPTAAAMTVLIIKGTSLASAIGYLELTQIGQLVSTATFRPLETSSFVAVIYLMIGWPILRLARRLDRKGRLARILRLLGSWRPYRCPLDSALACSARKAAPWRRKMSATSSAGVTAPAQGGGVTARLSRSSGLAVSAIRWVATWV